jgi:hypothetical protein
LPEAIRRRSATAKKKKGSAKVLVAEGPDRARDGGEREGIEGRSEEAASRAVPHRPTGNGSGHDAKRRDDVREVGAPEVERRATEEGREVTVSPEARSKLRHKVREGSIPSGH